MDATSLREDIAAVLCPRYPLGRDGLDFGDRGPRLLPGGFCCFAVDLPASLADLADARARAGGRFPYVASDLERGAGQQIAGLSRLPPALALGAAASEALCREAGALTAREARDAGVAWVFAPVVDVATEPRNPIVAVRAFGDDPREVARLAGAFVQGCTEGGAIATAKHYPGHGPTAVDSHLSLPTIDRSLADLTAIDELPFRLLIEQGLPSVMIGHLHVRALDEAATPATLSEAVIGRLRGALGFRGLVVTDALDMGAVDEGARPEDDPAVRTLRAGADVALLPRDPSRSARNLLAAVRSGFLPERRLREAAERIRTNVRNVDTSTTPSLTPRPEGADLARRIAAASVTLDPRAPAPPPMRGRRVHLALVDDGNAVGRLPALRAALAAEEIRVAEGPEDVEATLVAVFSSVRHAKGRVVLDAARADALRAILSRSTSPVILSIGCPQALLDVERTAPGLYVFDDDDASLSALAAALSGRTTAPGRMCFQAHPAAGSGP